MVDRITTEYLETIGMAYYEDDFVKICHHCGLILPDDDLCQCSKANLERFHQAVKRELICKIFLFCGIILFVLLCGVGGFFCLVHGIIGAGACLIVASWIALVSVFIWVQRDTKKY